MTDPGLPKVLIVDDEDDIRDALRQMLEELEDLEIFEVGDGQAALELMATTQFHLMLLDINLPVVGGEELLAALAGSEDFKRPNSIVVMSAQANLSALEARLRDAGVDTFLPKPFRYEKLQTIVADAIMPDLLEGL